jgi:galactokinase
MKVTEIIQKIRENEYDSIFKTLYTQKSPEDVANRYIYLLNSYKDLYGDEEVSVFSAPGRTELSGNHTDHNNGKVLAAAVDMDIIAVAGKRNDKLMRLRSVGYDSENTANLDKLDPKTAMKGTSNALLEGIADYFNKNGYKTG